ncbi:MAG: hypothetical protein AB1486_19320 [Planctomycetota bacterium]
MLLSKWHSLIARCSNPRDHLYKRYGARGVRVCREWRESFESFYDWAMGSGYRPYRNLDLLPGRKLFSPRNCRWITARQRMARDGFPGGRSPRRLVTAFRKQRKARRLVDWKRVERMYTNDRLSCAEIALRLGMNYYTINKGIVAMGHSPRRDQSRYALEHGSQLYKTWGRMRQAATNPRDQRYPAVGAKGLGVCDEWSSFHRFHAWALASGYRPGLCLSRLRSDRGFTPKNCEWTSQAMISLRSKPPPKKQRPRWTITAFGETKGPLQWSLDPRCVVSLSGLLHRLRSGMDPEPALTDPPRTPGRRDKPTRWLTAFGLTKPVIDWARSPWCKVGVSSLLERLERGATPEDAILKPPRRCPVPAGAPPRRRRRRR